MDEELNVDFNGMKEPVRPDTEFVEAETKKCRYCGRILHAGFDFCTYCGKIQRNIPAVRATYEKGTSKRASAKKSSSNTGSPLFFIFAMIAFSVAFLFFIFGWAHLNTAEVASGSSNPFGGFFPTGDNAELIKSTLYVVACLLTSLIFTVTGFFLLILKKLK